MRRTGPGVIEPECGKCVTVQEREASSVQRGRESATRCHFGAVCAVCVWSLQSGERDADAARGVCAGD